MRDALERKKHQTMCNWSNTHREKKMMRTNYSCETNCIKREITVKWHMQLTQTKAKNNNKTKQQTRKTKTCVLLLY